jgi:hypothetical protein
VEYGRSEESGEHDRPAGAVGQDAEEHQKRGSQEQGAGDEKVGRHRLDLQRLREEEERVELPGVPDDRLTSDDTEEREAFNIPVILSTVGVQMGVNGPTRPSIQNEFPV